MRPWTGRLALSLTLAALAAALPGRARAGGIGLDLQGGWAVPVSPEGPNSFSQAYGSTWEPAGDLWVQFWDDWRVGLEGRGSTYHHKVRTDATLQVWMAQLMVEWQAPAEDAGLKDRFLVHLGLGGGGADLSTQALYQSRSWASISGTMGVGWELPLHPLASLLATSDLLLLAGPGKADPILMATVSLGLRFQVTDTWVHRNDRP